MSSSSCIINNSEKKVLWHQLAPVVLLKNGNNLIIVSSRFTKKLIKEKSCIILIGILSRKPISIIIGFIYRFNEKKLLPSAFSTIK